MKADILINKINTEREKAKKVYYLRLAKCHVIHLVTLIVV